GRRLGAARGGGRGGGAPSHAPAHPRRPPPGRRLAPRPVPLGGADRRGLGRARAVLRRRDRLRRVARAGGRQAASSTGDRQARPHRRAAPFDRTRERGAGSARRATLTRMRRGLVLSFDTATPVATSALGRHGAVLGERTSGAASALADADQLLREAGFAPRDLDALVVGTGPGSFTGIRIGLAAARGLALALGIPVAGVSTLDALAAGAPTGALPVIDA